MSVPAGCVGPAVGVPGPPDDVLEWLTAPAPRDRPATSADAASTSDGDSDMMSMIVTLYKSGMVNLTMYWISLFSTVFAKWLSNVEYCCYIQGLFLDVFLATQLNWSWRFLSFFGFCLEFFLVFP